MINSHKISKSGGNFVTVQDVVDSEINPLALRYYYFTSHYRKQQNFTWEALRAANSALHTIYAFLGRWRDNPSYCAYDYLERFMAAVNDDLNMPEAVAVFWEMLKSDLDESIKLETAFSFDEVLGLQLRDVWTEYHNIPQDIWSRIKDRETKREDKDYASADEIRRDLEAKGYKLQDTSEGTVVILADSQTE